MEEREGGGGGGRGGAGPGRGRRGGGGRNRGEDPGGGGAQKEGRSSQATSPAPERCSSDTPGAQAAHIARPLRSAPQTSAAAPFSSLLRIRLHYDPDTESAE